MVAPPRNPARSSFGDAFAALHDDGPQRHGAALRYSVELLAYYYAAQGRQNPAQEAIRTLVTDRFDILDTPQFGLYAPKGQGAAVADAGLRIMDGLNAESVADPVWAGGADSTEAQRRADYAEQARGGRWVTDITGRHAILRDTQGRSVLAGSNISQIRLKGVPVVGFVMAQADQVQPLGPNPPSRILNDAGPDGSVPGGPPTGEAQKPPAFVADAGNGTDIVSDADATSGSDGAQDTISAHASAGERQGAQLAQAAPPAALADTITAQGRGNRVVYNRRDGTQIEHRGGSRAWRTNNPGNIGYTPWAREHGAIGVHRVPGLGARAIFPNLETGERAHRDLLTGPNYQNLDLDGAIKKYAPPEENDTKAYQDFIKEKLGLAGTTLLKDLTSEQLSQLLVHMRTFEGWRAGTVRVIPAPRR